MARKKVEDWEIAAFAEAVKTVNPSQEESETEDLQIKLSGSTPARGFLKGLSGIDFGAVTTPKDTRKQRFRDLISIGYSEEEALQALNDEPLTSVNEMQTDEASQQKNLIESLLGQSSDPIEKGVERGFETFGESVFFPGLNPSSMLNRSLVSGGLGQAGEEIGLGEGAQTLLEIAPFLTPNLSGMLSTKGAQGEDIARLRNLGFTDKQIAPTMSREGIVESTLAKISPRRGRTQKILQGTEEAFTTAFERQKRSTAGQKALSGELLGDFSEALDKRLIKLPADAQTKIKPELEKFINSPKKAEDIIDFWRQINKNFGRSRELQSLKTPLRNALKSIDPEIAKDFDTLNRAYSNFSRVRGKLQPNLVTDLYSAAGALKVLSGLALGNPFILSEFVGEKAARMLSRELILSPRFKNLSTKFIDAAKQGKGKLANSIKDQMVKRVESIYPDLATQLKEADVEEFINAVNE